MKKMDWLLGSVFFGFILFITCFCAGWWISVGLHANVITGIAIGAAVGIAVNVLFLRRIVRNLYALHPLVLIAVFLLYSVGIFGFFMGVPVFNAALGIAAGWYVGRRAKTAGQGNPQKPLRQAVLFSTAVLSLICAAAAWLALNDPTTAANLKGMLSLGFDVTRGMIWGIILIGGALLLVVQAIAAKVAAKAAYRMA